MVVQSTGVLVDPMGKFLDVQVVGTHNINGHDPILVQSNGYYEIKV
jgi:hypothetical protein